MSSSKKKTEDDAFEQRPFGDDGPLDGHRMLQERLVKERTGTEGWKGPDSRADELLDFSVERKGKQNLGF